MARSNQQNHRNTPWWSRRLVALLLAWAWAIVAAGIGLNALVKSKRDIRNLKRQVPPPTIVSIDDSDIFDVGVVATTVSLLIAVLTTIFLLMLVARPLSFTRTIILQASLLLFCTVWLFACMIPLDVFFHTRQAQVSASINGIPVSAQVIQTIENALGQTSVYNKIHYLRLLAILPWFAILFTFIASIVLFLSYDAVRKRPASRPADISGPTNDTVNSNTNLADKSDHVSDKPTNGVQSSEVEKAHV